MSARLAGEAGPTTLVFLGDPRQDAKAYRAGAGAGVAAVGAGAVDVTTTGYFAHAVRPTSEAISASTSVVDFRCEYMNGPPIAGVVRRLSCSSSSYPWGPWPDRAARMAARPSSWPGRAGSCSTWPARPARAGAHGWAR